MTKEECRETVEACIDHGSLTQWENSFLVNLADQLGRGRAISERQQELLEEIREKIGGERKSWQR